MSSLGGFCIALRKEVFDERVFQRMAAKSMVALYLDSPKRKKLPEDQVKHNGMVRARFEFGGGVPSALLVNPYTGEIESKISGYRPKDKYIDELKRLTERRLRKK